MDEIQERSRGANFEERVFCDEGTLDRMIEEYQCFFLVLGDQCLPVQQFSVVYCI